MLDSSSDEDNSVEYLFNVDGCTTQFKKFLESRHISDDIITYIISENIDSKTILNMKEDELKEIFPKYGDRLAITDFCKRQNSSRSKKKLGLIDKLKKKLATKKNSNFPENKEEKLSSTKFRKIELGWLHFSEIENKYIQVRTKKGGGTRQLKFPVSACKDDLLVKAKKLFFPNDVSSKGRLDEFIFDIMDFKECVLNDNISIEEIFKITRINRLKFYLTSKKKRYVDLLPYEHSHTRVTPLPLNNFLETNQADMTSRNISATVTSGAYTQSMTDPSPSNSPTESSYRDTLGNFNFDIFNLTAQNVDTSEPEPIKLSLHRGQVFSELINIFINKNVDNTPISIEMILPNGDTEEAYDDGGVFRDCLAEFWSSFYDQCTVGTTMKIPYLRHDFSTEKWEAIAKILHKGWKCQKYFPIKLIQPFMEFCILGSYDSDLLLSFMDYIPKNEAETLQHALHNFDSADKGDLIDILTNLESKWTPTKDNLSQLIHDIAHKDIIQKPKFIIDCWKYELKDLMTAENLKDVYNNAKPCAKKILKLLEFPTDLNEDTVRIIGFLKKYIRENDSNTLGLFLRYCTGSDIIIDKKITIAFIKSEGLARAPIARTCGCLLELPYSYQNYIEFRTEMNSILCSNIWVMDLP